MSLLSAMQAHGVDKIVFSSRRRPTASRRSSPLRKGTALEPAILRRATKLAIEKYAEMVRLRLQHRYVALRYFNAAGSDTEAGIGEDHNPNPTVPLVMKRPWVSRITSRHLRRGLPHAGRHHGVRDYIHVKDLQRLICWHWNIWSGAAAVTCSIWAMALVIPCGDHRNGPPDHRQGDQGRCGGPWGGGDSVLIASNKKAAEVLGWKPVLGLDQIISDAWAWHSGHPNGYEG